MLDEEKVKLMAEIAIYEKNQHQNLKRVGNYFKRDYIGGHLLKSFVIYQVGFLCVAGVGFLYHAEEVLSDLNLEMWAQILKNWGTVYAAGLLVYLFITRQLYKKRYEKAERAMRLYTAKLKRLERRYEFQARTEELMKGEQQP